MALMWQVVGLALSLSPDELQGAVSNLKTAVTDLKSDVAEIKEALGMPAVTPTGKCQCKALPDSIPREGDKVKTSSGTLLPETYGAECAQHDLKTDACSGEYKAGYCYESWCYVDEDCEEKDTKSSFFFGKDTKLYYSYQNCGGLDAFAAEACGKEESEETCTHDNCAWNKEHGCQNKLCQCSGEAPEDVEKLGFKDDYGSNCSPWDQESCAKYEEMDKAELGLWCCKSWCYVPEECPSAKKSAVSDKLFYSYYACPDDADALSKCPWDEPINFDGSPVALSSDAANALNDAATKQGFLRRMRKHKLVRRD